MRSFSAPGLTNPDCGGATRRGPLAVDTTSPFGVADVIVVRPERDVRVLQLRIAALDDGDDVLRELRPDHFVVSVEVEGELHAIETERRQRLLRLRPAFELLVLRRVLG